MAYKIHIIYKKIYIYITTQKHKALTGRRIRKAQE